MRHTLHTCALAALLSFAATVCASNALAAGASATQSAAAQARISKSKAASIAQNAVKGKVLKVDEVVIDGAPVYRVKILQNGGRVKNIQIDGINGKII